MKYIATLLLMLLLAIPAIYAQENPVKMKYSGSELTTAFLLQGPVCLSFPFFYSPILARTPSLHFRPCGSRHLVLG